MTDKVISFEEEKQKRTPHWSGPCVCIGCGHRWTGCGEMPADYDLECPRCTLPKGTLKHVFGPAEDELEYQCAACDSPYFAVSMEKETNNWRMRCLRCGNDCTDGLFE